MKNQDYDVIIVGARVAGGTLALHLAKRGHKVLLLEKGQRGQDTLSTHFVWPRGASYLNRLGVLNKVLERAASERFMNIVMDGIPLRGEVPVELQAARFERLHEAPAQGVQSMYFSARRKYIDPLLVNEAIAAGAELEESFTVDELLMDGEQVTGVRGTNSAGQRVEIRARVVVGADGRNSTVARQLKLQKIDPREACTFACYTYVTGADLGTEARIEKYGRLALATTATSDGAHMVLVYGPKSYYEAFRAKKEVNFHKTLALVNPDIAERVRAGHREEPLYSTVDQGAYLRQASGPGFALIGDAVSFKDQCTAAGMTHAFRDAELLGGLLSNALEGQQSMPVALKEYEQRRYVDSARYYEFVCQQAEMNPIRADERQIFEALQLSQDHTNRFLAMFGDTLPVRDFFSEQSVKSIMRPLLKKPFKQENKGGGVHRNPYLVQGENYDTGEAMALARNCADFQAIPGPDLMARTQGYYEWYARRLERETFQYSRTLRTFPGSRTELVDEAGRVINGINFASQDYLALGGHAALREAAVAAIHEFGPHSAGSPMIIGNTTLSQQLEKELGEMLEVEHVLLYATGWAAGYGSIASLVRPQDHIVMDRLSHSCLQQGAMAATKNILRHPHLDAESIRAYLSDIRSRDVRNGILVLTEGIFSMDADAPDLVRIQEICREFQATLLVDVAHDFGSSGPHGSGQLGIQGLLGKVDLVMGSFSKSFASNGGFLATSSASVKHYAKMYGSSHMFSNALSPVQAAVALAAARIMRTAEGDRLRADLLRVVNVFRDELTGYGLECLGEPGAIVPVMIGDEKVARVCHRLMQRRNIAAMILEYPVVAVGAARFRLQVMASHTEEEARIAARNIAEVIAEARETVARFEGEVVNEGGLRRGSSSLRLPDVAVVARVGVVD